MAYAFREFVRSTARQARQALTTEKIPSSVHQVDGFITKPGALLKDGRYKVIRKLGKGRFFSTFLVEEVQPPKRDYAAMKYLSANIFSLDSSDTFPRAIRELDVFNALKKRAEKSFPTRLPFLIDHFTQRSAQGVHSCFLSRPLSSSADAYRATSPSGRLPVHNVKPIIVSAADALYCLHGLDIIHGDVNAVNMMFQDLLDEEIEKTLATEPLNGDETFDFQSDVAFPATAPWPWNGSPLVSEVLPVILSNFGYALCATEPTPSGDIGSFALRAPENIIRAECGKPIDIWAIGCMTYELLTGEVLFQPPAAGMDLTPDESMLLMQYALTGETLDKTLVEQSRVKDRYFDGDGDLIKAKTNPYPSQTIKSLLEQNTHSELTARQIDAASQFIGDCLRLNPGDRKTASQVLFHGWLDNALTGGSDEPDEVELSDDPHPPPSPSYDTIPLH
ncbi:kinase-like protein [Auriscalpium vulgare]|uniref:Kinase-like protein n=1 Tax=Auriscalpium vulgare TaxID=40419 RepID=A0ACB8RLZ9_9AGAM|nr:kinase-like protein [Auriscalpium vulgare]